MMRPEGVLHHSIPSPDKPSTSSVVEQHIPCLAHHSLRLPQHPQANHRRLAGAVARLLLPARRRSWHAQQSLSRLQQHGLPREGGALPPASSIQDHTSRSTAQLGKRQLHGRGRPFRALWRLAAQALRGLCAAIQPQGPGDNDTQVLERALNVATCAPFFVVGSRLLRACGSAASRRFGVSFLVAGVAATAYHSTWGRLRCVLRKADHWAIAVASCALRDLVLGPQLPPLLRLLTLAAVPFRPSLLSTSNFAAVEVRCLVVALNSPQLLRTWAAHGAFGATAGAFYFLDGTTLMAWCPYAHALWHCCAAGAIATTGSFAEHLDGGKFAAHALMV